MQALRAAAAARRGAVPFPGSLAAAWSAVGSFRQYTVPARDGPRKQPLAPHHPSLRDQIVQRSNYKKVNMQIRASTE